MKRLHGKPKAINNLDPPVWKITHTRKWVMAVESTPKDLRTTVRVVQTIQDVMGRPHYAGPTVYERHVKVKTPKDGPKTISNVITHALKCLKALPGDRSTDTIEIQIDPQLDFCRTYLQVLTSHRPPVFYRVKTKDIPTRRRYYSWRARKELSRYLNWRVVYLDGFMPSPLRKDPRTFLERLRENLPEASKCIAVLDSQARAKALAIVERSTPTKEDKERRQKDWLRLRKQRVYELAIDITRTQFAHHSMNIRPRVLQGAGRGRAGDDGSSMILRSGRGYASSLRHRAPGLHPSAG